MAFSWRFFVGFPSLLSLPLLSPLLLDNRSERKSCTNLTAECSFYMDKWFWIGNIHLYLSNYTILSNPVEHFDILHYFITLLFCVGTFLFFCYSPRATKLPNVYCQSVSLPPKQLVRKQLTDLLPSYPFTLLFSQHSRSSYTFTDRRNREFSSRNCLQLKKCCYLIVIYT